MRKQEGKKDVAVAAVGRIEEEEEEEEEEEDGGAAQLEDSADCFFESLDRVPSGVSLDLDLPSSGSSSDDDEDDVRISFASAVGAPSFRRISSFSEDDDDEEEENDGRRGVPPAGVGSASVGVGENYDYGIWMAEPISVKERRRKLLQGMGLASRKEVTVPVRNKTSRRIPSRSRSRLISSRFSFISSSTSTSSSSSPSTDHPIATASSVPDGPTPSSSLPPVTHSSSSSITTTSTTTVARSQSDSQLFMMRNPAATTGSSFQRRSSSLPSSFERVVAAGGVIVRGGEGGGRGNGHSTEIVSPGSCKIKNLDTGKEFVVSENDGTVGRVNDGQTGLQLSMEDFEKFLGFSPIVKELMRRANLIGSGDKDKKKSSDNDITAGGATTPSKSSSSKHSSSNGGSSRKKGGWLKNIKFVASSVTGLISDKERENTNTNNSNNNASSSERMKVHQHGKSCKELTGLYMCQEIQAHQGSIWTIKFSWDSRYLATAGEDRVVHVWEVLECDTLSSPLRCQDQTQSFAQKPPLPNGSSTQSSKKTKRGKVSSANRRNTIPDYIVMPETVFSLSQKPVCSFEGHLDDVLDLSWSKSQYLLSSSMDKTVRLWDMETKACLKLFAHNDYVTCIQFNPIDDRYFISGSLDAKVRIWSIPDRHVVDWTDLHEMVTAACYTPDGQGALVGSHKGSCRFYNTSDCKLFQEGQIDIRNKKRKSNAKKITGFQFAPDNPSEVLITSADSQIRVFNGVDMIHKFRGFRNTSSQISASCSLDGKYVVCASEDSHVYIWKRDTLRNASAGGKSKGWLTTRSHEHFYCKDVSVAIPWPCGGSNYEPSPSLRSWSRRHTDDLPCNLEDSFSSSRSHQCPPLPKKSFSGELHVPSRSGSGNGSSSFVSSSASLRSGSGSGSGAGSGAASSFSSSVPPSLSSWGWGGNSNRISSGREAANAWGLVVVTAGLDGNIRVYQNFGMPLRLSRQPNLF